MFCPRLTFAKNQPFLVSELDSCHYANLHHHHHLASRRLLGDLATAKKSLTVNHPPPSISVPFVIYTIIIIITIHIILIVIAVSIVIDTITVD